MTRHFIPANVGLSTAPRLSEILTPETNSFGVLRLLMASLVLISHSYLYSAGTSEAEPLTAWLGQSLGEYAVQVFFLLSGVMVAQSFDRSRNPADFAVARGLRIFPALIVCVFVTAFVLGPIVSDLSLSQYFASPGLYTYVAKTLSLSTGAAPLPGVFENLPYAGFVNSSLWTLKYEVICYVVLAALGFVGLFEVRRRRLAVGGLLLVVATVTLTLPSDPAQYGLIDNVRYFTVFFFGGALVYLVRERIVIAGILLVPLFAVFVASANTMFAEVGSAAFLGYGSLYLGTMRFGPLREICNRYDISFGIYIFAGPIQQTLLWLAPGISPLLLTFAAFVIVVPLAFVSWIVIEGPSLRLRRGVMERIRGAFRIGTVGA